MSDKRLTKEQAQALYDDMHRAMQARMAARGEQASPQGQVQQAKAHSEHEKSTTTAAVQAVGKASYSKSATNNVSSAAHASRGFGGAGRFVTRWSSGRALNGQSLALVVLAFLGCAKVTLSAIEVSGVGRIEEATAAMVRAPVGARWTKEEAKILTALDARRVELEERGNRLEKREDEFAGKERALAIRLTELKELSERLKVDREKGDKQRNAQLDQLANVYGSMNPPEAAHLLEQLDVQVALSLVERMPEKRMAQILSLMNAQRALELTNLLTHRTR
jgi:flagellar motility protein MotE (MotC chaperone)